MKGILALLLGSVILDSSALQLSASSSLKQELTSVTQPPTRIISDPIVIKPIEPVIIKPTDPIKLPPVIKPPVIIPPIIKPPITIFSPGFTEGNMCVTPAPISPAAIDIHRSLMVHDEATLTQEDFSLRRTLQKISDDIATAVPAATPELIFRQFWDSQNDAASAQTMGNPLCSDNNGALNGIPFNKCPRAEGQEATGGLGDIANRIDNDYHPLALVNRVDLSDKGWKNCGEHRIVYGRQDGFRKNLIIFESVLPNPKPGCQSGCRDVIEFWVDLSSDNNPTTRAAKLADFFYNGLPGFRPVVHSNHYNATGASGYGGGGSGQIRTNQFLLSANAGLGPWTLKEFKTFLSCAGGACDFDIFPINVKNNPYGPLWDRDIATGMSLPALPADNPFAAAIPNVGALATNFQQDVVNQVTLSQLGHPSINGFNYSVDANKNAAESQSQSPVFDHYRNQLNSAVDPTFRNQLSLAAAPFGMTANQVVNRAAALSCAGCHMPSQFGLLSPSSIGPGMSWPNALNFVHVDTQQLSLVGQPEFNIANFAGNGNGSNISPALLNTFLPHREDILTDLANKDVCNCILKPRLIDDLVLPERIDILDKLKAVELDVVRDLRILTPSTRLSTTVAKESESLATATRITSESVKLVKQVEAEQLKVLSENGVIIAEPRQVVEPVTLSVKTLDQESAEKLKRETFDSIVAKEPERVTFTGSTRTH